MVHIRISFQKFRLSLIFSVIVLLCSCDNTLSQGNSSNPLLKWSTWILLQTIPSLTFHQDKNSDNSTLRTGIQWQIIPFSFTFRTNKYLSPVNFFYIKPVKRFSGSAELYFQPEYIFGGFKYANLDKFMFKTGIRTILPLAQRGEYLSFSVGAGLNHQRTLSDEIKNSPTIEAGVYSFFGMLGLKLNFNPGAISEYSFGLYFKYY